MTKSADGTYTTLLGEPESAGGYAGDPILGVVKQIAAAADAVIDTLRRYLAKTLADSTSVYFDTPRLDACRDHVQRRRLRWKVRSRLYVEDQLCRLEVKSRDGRGHTVKTMAGKTPEGRLVYFLVPGDRELNPIKAGWAVPDVALLDYSLPDGNGIDLVRGTVRIFLPLASADPYGGVVITDWYANPAKADERLKATVYILDTRLRAEQGIMASRAERPHAQGEALVTDTHLKPL